MSATPNLENAILLIDLTSPHKPTFFCKRCNLRFENVRRQNSHWVDIHFEDDLRKNTPSDKNSKEFKEFQKKAIKKLEVTRKVLEQNAFDDYTEEFELQYEDTQAFLKSLPL